MNKKVYFTIFMMLAIILCSGVTLAASGDMLLFNQTPRANQQESNELQSVQIAGDTLFVLANDQLFQYKPGEDAPKVLPTAGFFSNAHDLWRLASDGKDLFALRVETGQFFRWSDGNGTLVAEFDLLDAMDIQPTEQHYDVAVGAAVMTGEYLFLQYKENDNDEHDEWKLLRLSLRDHTSKILSIPKILQISRYQKGQLLITTHESLADFPFRKVQFHAMDYEGRITQTFPEVYDGYGDGGIAFDANTNALYAQVASRIVKLTGDSYVPINYVNSSEAFSTSFSGILPQGVYVFADRQGVHLRSIDPEDSDDRPIRIAGNYTNYKIIMAYQQENPDQPIVEDLSSYDTLEKIADAIRTGVETVDIFALRNRTALAALIERGYVAPIDSEVLRADVETMYPQIRNLLIHNGELYAYPIELDIALWAVNEDLLQKAGYRGTPESVKEVVEFALRWYGQVESEGADYPYDFAWMNNRSSNLRAMLFEYAYTQYVMSQYRPDQMLSFDSPEFRDILALIKQVPEDATTMVAYSGTEHEEAYTRPPFFRIKNTDYFNITDTFDPQAVPHSLIVPPPFTATDALHAHATLKVYVLNPHSQNTQGAISFLESISTLLPTTLDYSLHPQKSQPLPFPNLAKQIQELQADLAECQQYLTVCKPEEQAEVKEIIVGINEELSLLEKNPWQYTPEHIEHYRALAPFIDLTATDLLPEVYSLDAASGLMEIFKRYFDGEMDMNQVIRMIDNKIEMRFLEEI